MAVYPATSAKLTSQSAVSFGHIAKTSHNTTCEIPLSSSSSSSSSSSRRPAVAAVAVQVAVAVEAVTVNVEAAAAVVAVIVAARRKRIDRASHVRIKGCVFRLPCCLDLCPVHLLAWPEGVEGVSLHICYCSYLFNWTYFSYGQGTRLEGIRWLLMVLTFRFQTQVQRREKSCGY